ncbi:Glu/Leu/Phe/Val dehydrogenase dimerization domain-containing protein [Brockia lithotrophica]|uniref:Leucine dehydrogenase n=1 Tax=Brockia lithotrophica TaxID=933949 RepID=A0A660L9V4_9BACL|nr:Glu/Leu/Phe/Val dehydrogenase dimerization domain-containing protein [Brockia lithotrophica]RKQ88723.1 leucine dehydrogenase [Brockia lithotrophica]
MSVLERMVAGSYEQVVFCTNPEVGLRAIIAIHDTTLGPALGGVRMWPYRTEEDALEDVLRLARGMTYKNALAGLDLGGGKAVILGDPRKDKSEGLLRAFGRCVDSLGGRYVTAEDVGMTPDDMEIILRETPYVTGLPREYNSSGNPSVATAAGVFAGIRAALVHLTGSDSLEGRTVAVQGAGSVASHLVPLLREAGARVILADVYREKAEALAAAHGAEVVDAEEIYDVEADVFSPCALGGILNAQTIPRLRVRAVAGSANNQLSRPEDVELLRQRGILYAPDFVINAGGVINIFDEFMGYDESRALRRVSRLYDVLLAIFRRAEAEGRDPNAVAEAMAEERIARARAWRKPLRAETSRLLAALEARRM